MAERSVNDLTARAVPVCSVLAVLESGMAPHLSAKEQWFRQGVAAIRRALPSPPEGAYLCPLCLGWFESPTDLTQEHAPPKSLGGARVALTCRACNSSAGHGLDASMREFEDMIDFGARRTTRTMRADLVAGGATTSVEVNFASGSLSVVGLPQHTDPAQHAAVFEHFAELAAQGKGDGETFQLNFTKRYTGAAVRAGWLRAAYLVAFAKLGYRYILQPQLDPVRRQIHEPAGEHVGRAVLANPFLPPDRRELVFITKPLTLRGVMVAMGASRSSSLATRSSTPVSTDERTGRLAGISTSLATGLPGPSAPNCGWIRLYRTPTSIGRKSA